MAAIGLLVACGCGGEVTRTKEEDPGQGTPLSEACAALADPMTSTRAYDAARCEGLIAPDDILVSVRSSAVGDLGADGIGSVWGFSVARPGEVALRNVGVSAYDGVVVGHVSPTGPLMDPCPPSQAIQVLDSETALPEVVGQLPPTAIFENGLFDQDASCLRFGATRGSHVVTVYHSPEQTSFGVYDDDGAFEAFCGPCPRGPPLSECPCEP